MKPTLHMPTGNDWRNIFALGMIWHRLRDNIEIVRHCRDLVIDARPEIEPPMSAAEYLDYWREECATTGRE
jgi:hypothetical protein